MLLAHRGSPGYNGSFCSCSFLCFSCGFLCEPESATSLLFFLPFLYFSTFYGKEPLQISVISVHFISVQPYSMLHFYWPGLAAKYETTCHTTYI